MISTIEYALMAGRAYQTTRDPINQFPVPVDLGWLEMDHVPNNPNFPQFAGADGFEAVAFKRGNEIVISFAGTNPDDGFLPPGPDNTANILLGLGFSSAQLTQAAEYYLQVKAAVTANNPNATFTFTGHSLGGGLAALMGVFFGKQAVTFDQAPFAQSAIPSLLPGVAENLLSELLTRGYGVTALAGLTDYLQRRAVSGGIPNSDLVISINVQGELLSSGVPWNITDRIGLPTYISTNAPGVSGVDLHSQALLTVFLQSMQTAPSQRALNDVTFRLTDLMGMIFDENLYERSTGTANTTDESFLEHLVRHEAGMGSGLLPDRMVTRFTSDLWKLAQDGGLTITDGAAATNLVSKTLIAFAMQMYYENTAHAIHPNKELFTHVTGGVHFDRADVAATLTQAKGYNLYFQQYLNSSVFTNGERQLIQSLLPVMRDWYVQAGSSGMDVTDGQHRGAFMLGNSGVDTLIGGIQTDLLVGHAGTDRLHGGGGNDMLLGGVGNDIYVITGLGDGHDTIHDSDRRGAVYLNDQLVVGGIRRPEDEETAPYTSLDGQFTFVQSGSTLIINNTLTIQNWQQGDLGIMLRDFTALPDGSFPTILYTNSQPDITWDGDANDNMPGFGVGANHIAKGFGGNDWLSFEGGSALFNHQVFGGMGHDWLLGGNGYDRIFGEQGIDYLAGGGGDDVLFGGTETDIIHGDVEDSVAYAGNDYIDGGPGDDGINGDRGSDTIYGGDGNDNIYAEDIGSIHEVTSDYLNGGPGHDYLSGALGGDVLVGGDGDDRLFGDNDPGEATNHRIEFPGITTIYSAGGWFQTAGGADYLDGGQGEDELYGHGGSDVLVGGTENDTLYGDGPTLDGVEAGKDLLDGGAGDDVLSGGGEADVLLGGGGNDTLTGDFQDDLIGGNDRLDGGAGNDTLVGGRGDDILFGGSDSDVLYGNEGQDVLDGGSGNDELQGGSGADVLWGGTENDQLVGEEGSDTLFGGDGNDTLNGGEGDDVLVGGVGVDTLIGGTGADTYIFNLGDGVESIQDNPGEGNRVVFGAGITEDDISVGIGSLVVRVGLTGDAIHIQGFNPATPTVPVGIETFEFANGTILTQADLIARGFDLVGTANIDSLNGGETYRGIYGLAGDDVLTGGMIDNVLDGGDGRDVLFGNGGVDQLSGGTGDDVMLGGEGDDVLDGEDGNDVLQGEAGDDVLVGGIGDDQLLGGAGADTYLFNLGDGIDSLSDSNQIGEESRVVFGAGITSSTVTLTTTFGQVLVRPGATLEGVTIGANGSNVLGPRAVDQFEFADGSTLTYTDLVARGFEIDGTEFDDFLTGTNVVDRFRGGLGNDRLEGGEGQDSYFFNVGDGVDTIVDMVSAGAGNEVVFGPGITSADLRLDLAPDQSNPSRTDLLLHVGTNGDALQLDTFDRSNVLGPRTVETVRFADGSTLTYAQLLARGFDITGTTGDDQLEGTGVTDRMSGGDGTDVLRSGAGDDTLDGGAGHDRLIGGQGNDTYWFGPGSGQDVIMDAAGSLDRIAMAVGVSPSDVVATRDHNDLVLRLNGGVDQLTVSLYFLNPVFQVERVEFADGTVWDRAAIEDLVTPVITGTAGPDLLFGENGNERLFGLEGADQLTGLGGDDRLDGGAGADQLIGGTGDDTYVVDDAGDVVTELENEGTDTVQSSVAHTLAANVEQLILTGTAALNGTGNESDNVLTGNSAANVLTGGLGNDTYVVGAGDTVVEFAGEGIDTVQASISMTLGVNVENLTLTGSASLIGTGNALDNILEANGSVSVLVGGDGNDTYLIGPNGDDDILVETATGGIDTVIAAHDYRLPDHIEHLTVLDPRVPDFGSFLLVPYGASEQTAAGYGNELQNILVGGRANNVLDGGLGADTLIGGEGDDTYVVDHVGDIVTEQANEGMDTVRSAVSHQLSANVERLTLIGTAPIDGTGNALNNEIRGNHAANVLDGGAGNDSLMGFGGADTYLFGRGAGRDTVFDFGTADEIDTIQFDAAVTVGDVEVYRNGYDLELAIRDTTDELTLLSFFDSPGYDQKQVRFADGTVWNSAELSARALLGTTITGTFDSETILGSDGHDLLIGSAGNDVIVGGRGKDTLYGDLTFQPSFGNQIIGDDTLIGGAGDDTLVDFRGTNLFDGGAGNDTMTLGTGVDTVLFGLGSGVDQVMFDNNRNDVDVIEMAAGIALGQVSLTWRSASSADLLMLSTGDTLTIQLSTDWFAVGPETTQAVVRFTDGTQWSLAWSSSNVGIPTATSFDDVLDAVFPATLAGLDGDDTYVFGSSGVSGNYAVIEAPGEGIDTVQSFLNYVLDPQVENLILVESPSSVLPNAERGTGNELDNLLIGNTGDNILDGGAGNDVLVGGIALELEGPPYMRGTGSDILLGGAGDDVLMEDAGEFSFTGGSLFLTSTLDRRESVPRAANDLFIGGTGNDTYILHSQDQTVLELENEGTDTVRSTVEYVLGDHVENLTLLENPLNWLPGAVIGTGNALDNVLIGNSEDNVLSGGSGSDSLWGGRGIHRDTEIIRSGDDTLRGGSGHDTYLFNLGDGIDTIEDVAAVGEGNRIQFGAGITQSDLAFTHDQVARIFTIQVGSSGTDKLVLTNFDPIGANGSLAVTTVAFADGSVAQLAALIGVTSEITGTPEADVLSGTTGNDTMIGGAGNDILNGGAGNDTYVFNVGDGIDMINDTSVAGEGNTLQFGQGISSDDLTLDVGSLLIRIGTTGDAIHLTSFDPLNALGPRTIETFRFADGTVLTYEQLITRGFDLTGTAGNDTITGTNMTDRILGLAGNDSLTGDAGNDFLDGGTGNDTMVGSTGNDTYVVDAAGDIVTELADAGIDTVQTSLLTYILGANVENLMLTGAGPNTGIGNALNNQLVGNSGANLLNGGAGADTMAGGAGDDLYLVDHPDDVAVEQAGEGTMDSVTSSVSYTLSAHVENLVLTGAAALTGTGNESDNVLTGNSAANVLTGLAGNDTYVIGTGDTVVEAANDGMDTVVSSRTYTLTANVEQLILVGFSAINGTGNALDNELNGLLNFADNVLTGGAGNDTYILGSGDSTVEAVNGGIDTVQSGVTRTLSANVENLILTGVGAVNGTGNALDNALTGNSAINTLSGAGGNDTLRGGLGNDTVNGGSGSDTYLFGRGEGQDLVQDSGGSADRVAYDAGINPLDLVISRQANDLRLSIHGSTDYVTVQNWYTSSSNRTETIQAGNGQILLNTQVDQLIQAMASFSQQTGLTWDQAIVQQPQQVQAVLAASWQ